MDLKEKQEGPDEIYRNFYNLLKLKGVLRLLGIASHME